MGVVLLVRVCWAVTFVLSWLALREFGLVLSLLTGVEMTFI